LCYKFHVVHEKGVKTGVRAYQEDAVQGVVKPLNTTLFNGQKWVFRQDSAPAHKAMTTQKQLRRHVPALISTEDRPSGSPYLNPLNYKLWAVLEDMACRKRHNNTDSLKRNLVKAAAEIPLETVACRNSRTARASQGSCRGRGRPF
jgi:inhibitor of nuclear factor kappa-B kinase subunit alpha